MSSSFLACFFPCHMEEQISRALMVFRLAVTLPYPAFQDPSSETMSHSQFVIMYSVPLSSLYKLSTSFSWKYLASPSHDIVIYFLNIYSLTLLERHRDLKTQKSSIWWFAFQMSTTGAGRNSIQVSHIGGRKPILEASLLPSSTKLE